jgi:16S rRNA (adenine1518-N6/adenine1519-N6)-dimethyltransferase
MKSPIRPIKSLGQHFLTDDKIAKNIATAIAQVATDLPVLEIGPGTGILTGLLLDLGVTRLTCMEIDSRSVEFLNNSFPQLRGKIIEDDFLKAEIPFSKNEPFVVAGNFPYNISSQILFRVLENYRQIPFVVGMFQKEVAERIVSPPGNRDYGILSVLLQAHYDMEYLFTVPPQAFHPPPKVDSGVIRLTLKAEHELNCPSDKFKLVVKTAFNQRRKMLSNSLKPLLENTTGDIPFRDRRPEQLSWSDFEKLTLFLFPRH